MSAEKVLSVFADTLVKIGTEGAMAYLSVQVPFLNLPVVKQITKFFVGKIIDVIIHKTELGIYFKIIDFKTHAEAKAFEEIAMKHLEAVNKGDPNEIAKLEQEKIAAARKLIRIGSY